jgi:hypothetical protein
LLLFFFVVVALWVGATVNAVGTVTTVGFVATRKFNGLVPVCSSWSSLASWASRITSFEDDEEEDDGD